MSDIVTGLLIIACFGLLTLCNKNSQRIDELQKRSFLGYCLVLQHEGQPVILDDYTNLSQCDTIIGGK